MKKTDEKGKTTHKREAIRFRLNEKYQPILDAAVEITGLSVPELYNRVTKELPSIVELIVKEQEEPLEKMRSLKSKRKGQSP